MKKEFTKEDIFKKHETNVKSASTVILLSGVLGLIYLVRFFFSGNFNFFFSLSFTDMLLRLGNEGSGIVICCIISLIYALGYTSIAVLLGKNTKLLWVALGIYIFDFICLIGSMLFIFEKPVNPACFIDVLLHLFVLVFLVVGIISEKKLNINA